MKLLSGSELADFIKERQARQVRALRQAHHIFPRLAIVQTIDNAVIDSYVAVKKRYGADILIDVELFKIDQADLSGVVDRLNKEDSVHGIIIQLPLADESGTEAAVNAVTPKKDVDGLGENAILEPATPMAINWLLAGYNVDLRAKRVALIGNGRLVGRPLSKIWRDSGFDVTVFDRSSEDMATKLKEYDVIVTAAGAPGLVTSESIKEGAVIVDAGTAAEHGKILGDVAEDVRARDDISITPPRGGVGPLTVTALFENVIQAASATKKTDS